MWDLLNKADIEQARQDLKLRRAEILRRHAEEGQKLDADRLELETLHRLVDGFVEKFARPPIVSHAPIVAPVSSKHDAVKPSHEPRHHHHHHQPRRDDHRHQGQTVFATYMRAASRH